MEGTAPCDASVLIVEDNPPQADILAKLLEGAGYHIHVALSGEMIVKQLDTFKAIDVVLLDIMLPGMDGFEVCRRLKQHEATWDIPVLFLTSVTDLDSKLRAFDLGGVDYITKPFERKEVLARVRNYARLRRLQQQYLQQLERFRLLSQAAFEGILLVQQDIVMEANEVAAQVFGYAEADLIGQPVARLLPAMPCTLSALRMDAGRPLETAGLARNGHQIPLELHARELTHQREYACILAVRDVSWRKKTEAELRRYRDGLEQLVGQRTRDLVRANASLQATIQERQQAEEALRVSQQQYRQLAEQSEDGIGVLRDGDVVFANPALQRLLPKFCVQYAEQDACQRQCQPQFATYMRQYRAGHDPGVWRLVCEAHQPPRHVEGKFAPIAWDGEAAILLTVRDVTETTHREEALTAGRALLERQNRELKAMVTQRERFGEFVGNSVAMQRIYEAILKAAETDVNVAIWGESGTGKELAANTIHQHSDRQQHPFVPVNCSAIPETLFESELFGHCKGAFTNAYKDKPGLLDVAGAGTLFLDEINSLPLSMQVKLLRVLEGQTYRPVGGQKEKPVKARIIVAGNEDFTRLVSAGAMRLDFFYRVTVITIALPPLRSHKEDLPLLVNHFLERYRRQGRVPALPDYVTDELMRYNWPGNIRELQHVVHRYVTMGELSFAHLQPPKAERNGAMAALIDTQLHERGLQDTVREFERRLIQQSLDENGGHRGRTAEQLKVDPKTLYRKIKQYELE